MAATITEGVLWELQADDSSLAAAYRRAAASAERAGQAAQRAAQASTQAFDLFGKKVTAGEVGMKSLASGAVVAQSGMMKAAGGVERFNAGLDHVREFAWNNTGFSGPEIDRVINPIQGLSRAIGIIPTLAIGAAAVTVGALALIGAKAQSVLADIGDQAKQAGLSVDTLRGAEIVGAGVGLSGDKSREAIVNASQQFEQFKRNAGEVKDSIEKVDEKFLSVLDKTKNFGEFFDAVAQKIRQLPKEEGLDLSKALLGDDAGRRLFDQIQSGALDMRALGSAAAEAGGSIDDAARHAEEMKRKIDETSQIANQKLLVAFGDLADPIAAIELKWAQIKNAIADATLAVERFISKAHDAATQAREAMGIHATGGEPTKDVFARMRGDVLPPITVNAPAAGASRARYSARDDSGSSSKSTADRQSSIDRYIESLKESAATAQAEADNWGKGNVERAKAEALAKAKALAEKDGVALTAQQTQKVEEYAAASAAAKQRVEELREKQQELNAAMNEFASDVVSALDGLIVRGNNAKQVLADLARTLASSALRGALTGEGVFGKALGLSGSNGEIGGLFGQLFKGFSGLFADGGTIPAGGWGIAGERGPEIITGPAQIVPVKAFTPRGGQSQGSAQGNVFNFHFPPGTDARSFQQSEGQISAMVARAIARGQRNL